MIEEVRSRHPLTGLRAADTSSQEAMLARAVEVLLADERVLAAWLAGSFATGQADPFSDVDVHVCVEDDVLPQLAGDGWKVILHRITPTVLATTFPPSAGVGGYALAPDWTHIDLVFHARRELGSLPAEAVRPLLDRTGALVPRRPAQPGVAEPYFPRPAIDFYFYLFGNLVTVLGRNEVLLAMNGCISIRDSCLVPLLLAERGIRRSGGQKRLNPYLSDEQRRLLEGLPALEPAADSTIAFELAMARVLIPRGRALAAATGETWPADLEAATVAHVERALGVEVLPAPD